MTDIKEYIRDGRAPIPAKESTSRIMSSIKNKNTKPELLLRKALWHAGLKGYRLHWNKVHGQPDISYPGKKVAIFVNGCFWHRCPYCQPHMPKTHLNFWNNKFDKNVQRDEKKIMLLNQKGWIAFVIWECQLTNDLNTCVNIIRKSILKNA